MNSESINELAAALAAAQGLMKPALYNRTNPHYKSKYADLAAVWDAIREPMTKNGLSVTQTTQVCDGAFRLITTLRHSSGQWVSAEFPLPINAKPQEIGSALTYARRYSLSAIVGIASEEDDDGNSAQNIQSAKQPVAKPNVMTTRASSGEEPDGQEDRSPEGTNAPAADPPPPPPAAGAMSWEDYCARWECILEEATSAQQIGLLWNSPAHKEMRRKINPDSEQIAELMKAVEKTMTALRTATA